MVDRLERPFPPLADPPIFVAEKILTKIVIVQCFKRFVILRRALARRRI